MQLIASHRHALRNKPFTRLTQPVLWLLALVVGLFPLLFATLAGAALRDADARVRVAAVRTSERFLPGPDRADAIAKLIALSGTESAAEVQLQVALSLGEAKDHAADLAMVRL